MWNYRIYWSEKTAPILIEGLTKLEYRGYDSAGICVLENKELKTIKKKGRIADLKNLDVDKPRNLAKSVTVE